MKYLIYLRHDKLKSLFASQAVSNQRKWEKVDNHLKEKKQSRFWDFTRKQCEAKYNKQYNKKSQRRENVSQGDPLLFWMFLRLPIHLKQVSRIVQFSDSDRKVSSNKLLPVSV